MTRWILLVVMCAFCAQVQAQDNEREETLADVRQDLSYLYVEIQKLKRELSTTSSPNRLPAEDSILQRINNIEAQLQRLTNASERLEFKLQNVIEDGTSRIGDLEFRLVELEGGDVSGLSETTTLGGNADVTEPEIIETKPVELAVGEEADFDTAQKHLKKNATKMPPKCSTGLERPIPPVRLQHRHFYCAARHWRPMRISKGRRVLI